MEQRSDESLFELQLDHNAGNHFIESSKWARFLSVIYFVIIGIFALALVFGANAVIELFAQYNPEIGRLGGVVIAVLVLAFAIFFITTYLLFRFASLTKQGIERQDQIVFNKGLQALKNYFTVYGVITLLGIVFTLITSITDMLG